MGTTRRAFADVISSNYFSTLGVQLSRGRAFSAEEERPGSGLPVAIVSYPYWRRAGSDPDLVGKTVRVNGRLFTIVGITAAGFSGTTALVSPELYLPLGMYEHLENDFEGPGRPLADPDNYQLIVVGRLRPGLRGTEADSQLRSIAPTLVDSAIAEAGRETRELVVRPLSRLGISTRPTSDAKLRIPALLLLSMASVVLLIASLNVANMMLARGSARRQELSIRLALGAGRRSVLRQLVTESLLLAILGGTAGLAVAYWGTTALVRSLATLAPIDIVYNAGPDLRVLAATLGFCVLSTLLFGLGPALHLSKSDVFTDLRGRELDGSAGAGSRSWRGSFSRRNLLVVGQLALSLMLLATAGLFLRSSARATRLEPGFRVADGLLIEVDPGLLGYDDVRNAALYRDLLPRLRALPGVQSASLAATVPFGMVSQGNSVQRASDPVPVPGEPDSAPAATASGAAAGGESPGVLSTSFNVVGTDYFKTLDIPLLRGREFGERDAPGAQAVAIIDRLAAEKLWPSGDALGQRLRILADEGDEHQEVEIVGVVGSVQLQVVGADERERIQLYVPFGQQTQSNMTFHLRTAAGLVGSPSQAAGAAGGESPILEAARREIRTVDPELPVLATKSLRRHLEDSFDFWLAKTAARMFLLFGGVALLMAVIGLYGVRAYAVARRTREIGIRMALGASAGDALRMVLREGARLTALGVGLGLVLALAIGKLLSGLLYEVSGLDPLVFATSALALAGASLLACYLPARRAARIEPMVALRDE